MTTENNVAARVCDEPMQADEILKIWRDCGWASNDGNAIKFARAIIAANSVSPRGDTDVQPVGQVWYDREDGFYFAKIEAQDRVKAGDALYLAAVPRERLPQPGAADRFARARQALQQGIDNCTPKYNVTQIDSASTELPKE